MIATCLLSFAAGASAQSAPKHRSTPMTIRLGDASYVHRWSQNGQNEFTPRGETDLSKWRDMVTISVFENVTTSEELAELVNRIVAHYESQGTILRRDTKAATKNRPAEFLIVAVLGNSELREAAFTRLMLRNGVGYAVIRAHRFYGNSAGAAMDAWVRKNGRGTQTTLMAWSQLPSADALKRLPQSE